MQPCDGEASQPERKEYLWSAAIGSYLNECHSKCCYFFNTPHPPPPSSSPLVPEKRNIYSLGTCGLLKQVTFLSFSRLNNSIMIVTGAPVRLREAIHMRYHPDNIIRYSGIENTRACKSTIKKHMRQSVTEVKQWRNEHQPVGLMMGNERNQTHQWQPESSCSR